MNTTAFPSIFITLFVAHQVADHWLQTDHQATYKHLRNRAGRRACAAHVAERLAQRIGKAGLFHLGAPLPGRDDNPSLGTGAYALDLLCTRS